MYGVPPLARLRWIVSFHASYNGTYNWARTATTTQQNNLGNTITGQRSWQVDGTLNFETLYNKSKYWKSMTQRYTGRQRQKAFKPKTYNETVTLTAGEPKSITHRLGSELVEIEATDSLGHKVKVKAAELWLYSTTITARPKPKPKPQPKPKATGKPATKPRGNAATSTAETKTQRSKVASATISGGNLQLLVGASTLKANAKDCASFTITVTNNGTEAVTTPLTVTGKGVVCNTRQVTVAARSSRSVTATFTGITAREQRAVTVKTALRSTTKTITLTPFFTEF